MNDLENEKIKNLLDLIKELVEIRRDNVADEELIVKLNEFNHKLAQEALLKEVHFLSSKLEEEIRQRRI